MPGKTIERETCRLQVQLYCGRTRNPEVQSAQRLQCQAAFASCETATTSRRSTDHKALEQHGQELFNGEAAEG